MDRLWSVRRSDSVRSPTQISCVRWRTYQRPFLAYPLREIMPGPSSPRHNRLLAALPDAEYDGILPFLEEVPLELGKVLYESGGEQSHVYFPTASIVSLLYVMQNGSSAEIAVVGNEGIVGV